MAQDIESAARNVAIELITSNRALPSDSIKILQASLRDAGYFNGPINGTAGPQTGKAIAEFLSEPVNRTYAQSLNSAQIKKALDLHLADLKSLPPASEKPTEGFLKAFFKPDSQKPVIHPPTMPYSDLFEKSTIAREIGNPGIEDVLAYPGTFDAHNIKRLQTALGVEKPDGHFGHHTQTRLSDYLKKNPEIYATISPSALQLMLSDMDSAAMFRQSLSSKPAEYLERVAGLINATKNISTTNALTYDLQRFLDIGGYFRTQNNQPFSSVHDGAAGPMTDKAIIHFQRDYAQRTLRSEAKAEIVPHQEYAGLDPNLSPTPIPSPGALMALGAPGLARPA